MNIKNVLEFVGLDTTKRIKIVRHRDKSRSIDIHELYATGYFEMYQSYQEINRYKDCDFLISCIGIENNQALFVGIYEVESTTKIDGFPNSIEAPFKGKAKINSKYMYDLRKISGFEELENRIIIQWDDPVAWCQNIETKNKEVVQLLPTGYARDFPGYLDFILRYWELQKIINDPTAYSIWHNMLSSVAGVYLIVDTQTGMQYVGSAYGKEGILGRWKDYARNGHGGNKKLKEFLSNDPNRVRKFTFTILQTLPNSLSKNDVLQEEKKYKDKLGSRAHGLNLN